MTAGGLTARVAKYPGMYWAVAGEATRRATFPGFYVANAFHVYVTQVVVGMGWLIVEEREDYETLKYVYTSPIGMLTYIAGRSSVKLVLATLSVVLALLVGWSGVGVRWSWGAVAWAPLFASFILGLAACVALGFLVAGLALLLPRAAVTLNEGLAVSLYLLCGVIFPIDLLPRALQSVALLFPFTYWYEATRRFLLGQGASVRLEAWTDGALLGALFLSTLALFFLSRWGYFALETRARQLGRLDQTTLF